MTYAGSTHGHAPPWPTPGPAPKARPPFPNARFDLARLTAQAAAAVEPLPLRMPLASDLRYAFTESLESLSKPKLFTTAGALAGHIHRIRLRQSIQLSDDEAEEADGARFPIVSLYIFENGARTRLLGHAYVAGGKAERLQAALDAASRPRAARVRLS